MNLKKEVYERLTLDVTKFDAEDVITTSDITTSESDGFYNDPYEDGFPGN